MPLPLYMLQGIETRNNQEKVINILVQEMNLSRFPSGAPYFTNDVPDKLRSVFVREKEFSEFLAKVFEKAGIGVDLSELLINKESILNQIDIKLEAADKYEELLQKYSMLTHELELCQAELSNSQNDEL